MHGLTECKAPWLSHALHRFQALANPWLAHRLCRSCGDVQYQDLSPLLPVPQYFLGVAANHYPSHTMHTAISSSSLSFEWKWLQPVCVVLCYNNRLVTVSSKCLMSQLLVSKGMSTLPKGIVPRPWIPFVHRCLTQGHR